MGWWPEEAGWSSTDLHGRPPGEDEGYSLGDSGEPGGAGDLPMAVEWEAVSPSHLGRWRLQRAPPRSLSFLAVWRVVLGLGAGGFTWEMLFPPDPRPGAESQADLRPGHCPAPIGQAGQRPGGGQGVSYNTVKGGRLTGREGSRGSGRVKTDSIRGYGRKTGISGGRRAT